MRYTENDKQVLEKLHEMKNWEQRHVYEWLSWYCESHGGAETKNWEIACFIKLIQMHRRDLIFHWDYCIGCKIAHRLGLSLPTNSDKIIRRLEKHHPWLHDKWSKYYNQYSNNIHWN